MSRLEEASKVQLQSSQSGFYKPTRYTSKLSSKDSTPSVAVSFDKVDCEPEVEGQHRRNVFDSTANYSYHEPKPSGSYSAPLRSPSQRPASLPPVGFDEEERAKFMLEIERAKRDLDRFRNEMAGLAKQMDGMAVDLKDSKDRVCMYTQKLAEIEHDLTETQEVNVDLQVLLENAVKSQKETDGQTNNIIRNLHSSLATIVYENSQLQDRLTNIENYQQKHQDTVQDVGEKMREYVQMLGQAQGTLQVLQAPRVGKPLHTSDDLLNALSVAGSIESRRTSELSSIFTDDDDVSSSSSFRKRSEMTSPSAPPETLQQRGAAAAAGTSNTRRGSVSPEVAELYRHRIIRKRTSLPDTTASLSFTKPVAAASVAAVSDPRRAKQGTSPQQGLKILLRNQEGQGIGLSSLARRKS